MILGKVLTIFFCVMNWIITFSYSLLVNRRYMAEILPIRWKHQSNHIQSINQPFIHQSQHIHFYWVWCDFGQFIQKLQCSVSLYICIYVHIFGHRNFQKFKIFNNKIKTFISDKLKNSTLYIWQKAVISIQTLYSLDASIIKWGKKFK